ncbi:endonuclease-reverse transcriptase, partial [Elysia marginata]
LAPSDYHLFGPLKRELAVKRFDDDEELVDHVRKWLQNLDGSFFREGIYSMLWQQQRSPSSEKSGRAPLASRRNTNSSGSLVSSILTYGCETWTLLADTERRIQAFENKCLRKLLRISYKDHVTNESVRELVVAYVGLQEPLLATVKRRKLAWFGHVTIHDSLSKTILQGRVEGKRRRGRQRKAWCDNIKEWTGMAMDKLVRSATDRDAWRQKTDSSALRSPRRPHRSRD